MKKLAELINILYEEHITLQEETYKLGARDLYYFLKEIEALK